jgi:glycosyltransferase involved in cell wall biosynthesis
MKVLILSTTDTFGGAARAMYRLHKGFHAIGIDSRILCLDKFSNDTNVTNLDIDLYPRLRAVEFFDEFSSQYINQKAKLKKSIFNSPGIGYSILNHPLVMEADVINLHWVAGFLSTRHIAELISLGKPVVWTFHDEWAYTAGCHYTNDCHGFLSDCAQCPQIESDPLEFTSKMLINKIEGLSKLDLIITPSRWLSTQVEKSIVFKNIPREVIPYSIESDLFHPVDKTEAKRYFGIDPKELVILFGADDGSDKRKGFHKVVEAFHYLNERQDWQEAISKNSVKLLIFGHPSMEIENLKIPFTLLGRIENDQEMAMVYSAADLFLLPSLEDNLPNTMLESFGCGTPIVAFHTGGMVDMIKEGINGYLAPLSDAKSFSEKIIHYWQLSKDERSQLGKNARDLIERNYQLPIQAKSYEIIFSKLLNNLRNEGSRAIFAQHDKADLHQEVLGHYKSLLSYLLESQDRLSSRFAEMILAYRKKNEPDFHWEGQIKKRFRLTTHKNHFHSVFDLASDSQKSMVELYWIPAYQTSIEIELNSFAVIGLDGTVEIPTLVTLNADFNDGKFIRFYRKMPYIIFSLPEGKWKSFSIEGHMRMITNEEANLRLSEMFEILRKELTLIDLLKRIIKKIPFMEKMIRLIHRR